MPQVRCKHCKNSSLSRAPKTDRQKFVDVFFAVKNYRCDDCGRDTLRIASKVPKPATLFVVFLLMFFAVSSIGFFANQREINNYQNTSARQPITQDVVYFPDNNLNEKTDDKAVPVAQSEEPAVIKDEPEQSVSLGAADENIPEVVLAETVDIEAKSTSTVLAQEVHSPPAVAMPQLRTINSEDSLLNANPAYFTLQIASEKNRSAASEFAESLANDSQLAEPVFVYQAEDLALAWHPVFYGYFESREEADRGKASLPDELQRNSPYVRQIAAIQEIIRQR